jgi:uncharacterized protein DUF4430
VNKRAPGLLLLTTLILTGRVTAASAAQGAQTSPASKHDVVLTLKVSDSPRGLALTATKTVPAGSNALQVLQDTITVKVKTYPELGAFVTSLCGIDAPEGKVWTFTVDDKWSNLGIGKVTLERDTVIEWVMH